jgi:hypothetical protein
MHGNSLIRFAEKVSGMQSKRAFSEVIFFANAPLGEFDLNPF